MVEFELQVDRNWGVINGKQTVIGVVEETDQTSTNGQPELQEDDPCAAPNGGAGAPPANPRMRTLYFEYDLWLGKLSLPPEYAEPRRPLWASISPEQWILTHRGTGRADARTGTEQQIEQQNQQQGEGRMNIQRDKTSHVQAIQIHWSRRIPAASPSAAAMSAR